MKKSNIFGRHGPGIRLTTRFDAEGREIEVEVREDEESTRAQQEIMDMLVESGYFRAYIRGLSTFNKIVGGMVWCMEACDHDVDVDLLFDESLIIGQQIALTEKIIAVLPEMQCPYQLEPHQIQGLDVIHIQPVVKWLCKKSSENRREKAKKLRDFAVGQFHNSFQLKSDLRIKRANLRMLENIRHVEGLFGAQGQFGKRRALEQEFKGQLAALKADGKLKEVNMEALLKTLSSAGEAEIDRLDLEEEEREKLKEQFARIKLELEMDSEELKKKTHLAELDEEIGVCEGKLKEMDEEYSDLLETFETLSKEIEVTGEEKLQIQEDVKEMEEKAEQCEKSSLTTVQQLIARNEQVKQEEQEFKESCRREMVKLQKIIDAAEKKSPEADAEELQNELQREVEQLAALRLHVAKQNRHLTTVQRQLDNIPDRTELAQYQKRFLELYNQVSAKHRETKQFFSLYNTLSQTQTCLDKELNLLNSIFDSYHQAMGSSYAKAEFVKQLESYVESIGQLKSKQRVRCDEEKRRRDQMNDILLGHVDEQRHLAAIIKQLKQEFSRNDELNREYKVLRANMRR